MGNCQAAEVATVIIQHPSGRIRRVYWSVSASEIMNENPGHYVASLSVCFSDKSGTGVTRIRLLRPQDTLHMGKIYRLISSKEIMKELWEKHGKNKLQRRSTVETDSRSSNSGDIGRPPSRNRVQPEEKDGRRNMRSQSLSLSRSGQWRPSLQSISEVDYPSCSVNTQKQLTYSLSAPAEFSEY